MSASFRTGNRGERSGAPIEALRRFTSQREPASAPAPRDLEHCELCSEVIPADHRHLLDLSKHVLLCACQACSLLFSEDGTGTLRYRLVPRRYLALLDFQMTDRQWDELCIPVHMAFLFPSTEAKQVMAFYPSPAGATESLLDLAGWEELASSNPLLRGLTPDVEALLINRVKDEREHYIVPIDTCYELVGLIRSTWRGLSGGDEARQAIATFFQTLRAKAQRVESQAADHPGAIEMKRPANEADASLRDAADAHMFVKGERDA